MLHYSANQPQLATHNLIMGIAIGVLAVGFAVTPTRMYGLSWAMCAMGAWMIIAPWVVGSSPDLGVILNNVIIGGLIVLLGILCASLSMKANRAT